MATNFTPAQEEAIRHRGSSVLVAAAAGSGKTAVLVERIIRMIVNDNKDADKFLIVTFTKAAAQELRSRISSAIDSALRQAGPEERDRLIDQKNRVSLAQICTIDSFASNIVKSNAQALGLSSSFSVLSDKEGVLLENEIANETLGYFYEKAKAEEDTEFYDFIEFFSESRDDKKCIDLIIQLNKAAEAFPFYDKWLDNMLEKSAVTENIEDHFIWQLYIGDYIKRVKKARKYILGPLEEAKDVCDPSFTDLMTHINARYTYFSEYLDLAEKNEFEKLALHKGSVNFRSNPYRTPSEKKEYTSEQRAMLAEVKEYAKVSKDAYDALSKKQMKSLEVFGEEQEKIHSIAKVLVSITKKYHENLMKYKIEHNRFRFNDIQHFAIELLCRPGDDYEKLEPTEFALEYRKNLVEICIDEFQDTNKTQCAIFESLSTNNLFMVGDMKQSIYRFRQAQPELFSEIRRTRKLSNGEDVRVIVLGNNFRSRKSVTDSTNFVFEYLMNPELGEVDYNEDEKLIQSREFSDAEEKLELHILQASSADEDGEEDADSALTEATHIAKIINDKITSGFLVQDKDVMRPCRPSDFFILARSLKTLGSALVTELKKYEIGSYVEVSSEFFDSYEITLVLNLIKVINNPGQDIPLASVMMSILYGFSSDDMAEIRVSAEDKGSSLYALLLSQEKKNSRIRKLFEDLKNWRNLAMTMNAADFLRRIYDDTGIENYAELMPSPAVKRSNLSLLLHYAAAYEAEGNYGISDFIRYTDRLKESKQDYEGSLDKSSAADVVRIMTIHKSKGLQAPIVILADMGHGFNLKDMQASYLLSPKCGFGFQLKTETEDGFEVKNNSISLDICKTVETSALKSECLRLLYVAMTRAEERLILTGCVKDVHELKVKGIDLIEADSSKLPADISLQNQTFLKWIVLGLLRHPDAGILRTLTQANVAVSEDPGFGVDVFVIENPEFAEKEEVQTGEGKVDEDTVEMIRQACSYKYPFMALSSELSKIAASEASEQTVHTPYFATAKPAFLSADGFTAAQRGTITHKFMQYIDFDAVHTQDGEVVGVEEELFRLVEKNLITAEEADAVYVNKVKRFFASDLAARMKKAPILMREKRFLVHFDIDYYNPELADFRSEDDKLTIQGIVDAAFVEDGKLVIVDYKTDSIPVEAFYVENYSTQLKTYRDALVQCTPYKEVSSLLIYSFELEKEIPIY